MSRVSNNVSNFRRRRKENLIKVCGQKCNICGYAEFNSALEFHHINAEEKQYGVAASGNCHNLEKDLNEVKKCILVCANCHRAIHAGKYSQDFLREKQIFLEDQAKKLLKAKEQLNTKTQYFCSNCGKQITKYSKSGLCVNCSNKARRKTVSSEDFNKNNNKNIKIEDNRPNREELKNLIRIKPFTQIGSDYGVTDNAVRKWCDKFGLPRTKKQINIYSDKQWENI